MPNKGPILILDSDEDDHVILQELLNELKIANQIEFIKDGEKALHYLRTTEEIPFLIISEVNLNRMDGLAVKRQINAEEKLRQKAIPFVFLTDNLDKKKIEEAYEMMVQGYFIKKHSLQGIKNTLQMLLLYWSECLHRNSDVLKVHNTSFKGL